MNAKYLLFMYDEMIRMGIMPYNNTVEAIADSIALLGPIEARKLKRKFRKLWRSEMKRVMRNTTHDCDPTQVAFTRGRVRAQYGTKGQRPNKHQARARRGTILAKFQRLTNARVVENEKLPDEE